MVRWSVSTPIRGTPAAIRRASYAHIPARRAWLGVCPERLAVIDAVERMLEMTLRRQHQGGHAAARLQSRQVLRGQRVQPAQPVRAGDRDHAAVRQIHNALTLLQPALLAHRVAEMPGHAGVDAMVQPDRHAHLSVLRLAFLPPTPSAILTGCRMTSSSRVTRSQAPRCPT